MSVASSLFAVSNPVGPVAADAGDERLSGDLFAGALAEVLQATTADDKNAARPAPAASPAPSRLPHMTAAAMAHSATAEGGTALTGEDAAAPIDSAIVTPRLDTAVDVAEGDAREAEADTTNDTDAPTLADADLALAATPPAAAFADAVRVASGLNTHVSEVGTAARGAPQSATLAEASLQNPAEGADRSTDTDLSVAEASRAPLSNDGEDLHVLPQGDADAAAHDVERVRQAPTDRAEANNPDRARAAGFAVAEAEAEKPLTTDAAMAKAAADALQRATQAADARTLSMARAASGADKPDVSVAPDVPTSPKDAKVGSPADPATAKAERAAMTAVPQALGEVAAEAVKSGRMQVRAAVQPAPTAELKTDASASTLATELPGTPRVEAPQKDAAIPAPQASDAAPAKSGAGMALVDTEIPAVMPDDAQDAIAPGTLVSRQAEARSARQSEAVAHAARDHAMASDPAAGTEAEAASKRAAGQTLTGTAATAQNAAQNTAQAAAATAAPAAASAPLLSTLLDTQLASTTGVTSDPAAMTADQTSGTAFQNAPSSMMSRASAETTALLAAQIAQRLNGRSTRFDMVLTPEDLGRVDVSIEIDGDGQLAARLAFDNPAAAADLRARADELRRQLMDAGFRVDSDSLDFAQRDTSSGGQSQHQRRDTLFASAARVNAMADSSASPLPPSAIWGSANPTSDRVDVRV